MPGWALPTRALSVAGALVLALGKGAGAALAGSVRGCSDPRKPVGSLQGHNTPWLPAFTSWVGAATALQALCKHRPLGPSQER